MQLEAKNTNTAIIALLGVVGMTLLSLGFAVRSSACAHWFLVPVTICGGILWPDAVDWLRGHLDVFDPAALVALFGIFFFFLAPILHVYYDQWIPYVTPPSDWRPWLGWMASGNAISLLLYRWFSRPRRRPGPPSRTVWRLNLSRWVWVVSLALVVTGVAQMGVFARFGGVQGYILAYETRADGFAGLGWLLMIAESFPILALMGYATMARERKALPGWFVLAMVGGAFLTLKILFGGLRGSRSNTVFGLFWAAGIIHVWLRPLNRKVVFVGLIGVFAFMVAYSYYKRYGLEALTMMRQADSFVMASHEAPPQTHGVLLGDFGRSDVQAFLLYRLIGGDEPYEYRWGKTYVAWLANLLPKPWRPALDNKRMAGTEAQYGYYAEDWLSSRVYGLGGEALLNFGILGVPVAYAFLGILVAWIRRWQQMLDKQDIRQLLLPILTLLAVIMLGSDANNCEFFLLKNGLIPLGLFRLSASIQWRRGPSRPPVVSV